MAIAGGGSVEDLLLSETEPAEEEDSAVAASSQQQQPQQQQQQQQQVQHHVSFAPQLTHDSGQETGGGEESTAGESCYLLINSRWKLLPTN